MDNVIVSPMFFYWLDIIPSLSNLLLAMAIAMIIISIGLYITLFIVSVEYEFDETEKDFQVLKKMTKIKKSLLIIGIILTFVYCFIPSKATLIEMAVAKNVTYDTVERMEEKTKNIIDYIIEKSSEVKDNNLEKTNGE